MRSQARQNFFGRWTSTTFSLAGDDVEDLSDVLGYEAERAAAIWAALARSAHDALARRVGRDALYPAAAGREAILRRCWVDGRRTIAFRIGRRVGRGALRLEALEREFQLLDLPLDFSELGPNRCFFSRLMVT